MVHRMLGNLLESCQEREGQPHTRNTAQDGVTRTATGSAPEVSSREWQIQKTYEKATAGLDPPTAPHHSSEPRALAGGGTVAGKGCGHRCP